MNIFYYHIGKILCRAFGGRLSCVATICFCFCGVRTEPDATATALRLMQ